MNNVVISTGRLRASTAAAADLKRRQSMAINARSARLNGPCRSEVCPCNGYHGVKPRVRGSGGLVPEAEYELEGEM